MSDEPIVVRVGDDFKAVVPDLMLRFDFKGLHEERHRTYADLTITCDNEALKNVYGELFWDQGFCLGSDRTRNQCAAVLADKWPDGALWPIVLHEVCRKVVRTAEKGQPFVELEGRKRAKENPRYRLNPLLPDGQITLLFADGGTGKGFFAMAAGLSIVAAGRELLGMPGFHSDGEIGYLDWETDEDEINDRWARVCEGAMEKPPKLSYRPCIRPIADDLQSILRWRADRHIALLIVDSMGLAVGGNPNDSGDTLRAMGALRELNCTILALDHQGKSADAPGQRPNKSMGNSYKFHHSRSVWELRQGDSHQDGVIDLGIFHHKANNGRRSQPLAVRIAFEGDDGPVTFDPTVKASEIEGVKDRVYIGTRITDLLKESGAMKRDAIKGELADVKGDSLDKALKRSVTKRYLELDNDGLYHIRTVR